MDNTTSDFYFEAFPSKIVMQLTSNSCQSFLLSCSSEIFIKSNRTNVISRASKRHEKEREKIEMKECVPFKLRTRLCSRVDVLRRKVFLRLCWNLYCHFQNSLEFFIPLPSLIKESFFASHYYS
ncbi:hypothetical protein CDAR_522691 [Caerostris darwini]|uniref:Uncharacterized protein n=1 Tax=Caerostris darwini TaxID=1538125 RepID=A0AAV4PSC1_9ARAC|nr:hypothetical protein CDAR_522691 [Caerostris darwini]